MGREVPGATRALRVLRHLAASPRPVAAGAVARDLELPRSSIYHLIAAMANEGFVVHLPEEGRYGLGVAAFEVGSAYLRHDGLTRLARPLLERLVEDVGATAHLGVLDARELVYLLEQRPSGTGAEGELGAPAPLVTDVGVRMPATLTASGRCLLAHLPPVQVRALFPDRAALTTRTGAGPATPGQLRRALETARRAGIATERGEVSLGYASVAAPAFDHSGRPVAAVTVTVTERDVPVGSAPQLTDAVRAVPAALTTRLVGTPPRR